jgi:hypothetical protein
MRQSRSHSHKQSMNNIQKEEDMEHRGLSGMAKKTFLLTMVLTFFLVFPDNARACGDTAQLGPFVLEANPNNPTFDPTRGKWVWGYEIVENNKTPKSIWFGITYNQDKPIEVSSPNSGVYYPPGVGAGSYADNFGKFMYNTRVYELVSKGKFDWTDLQLFTDREDAGCVSVAVKGGTSMVADTIRGPGAFFITGQVPDTYPSISVSEHVLPPEFENYKIQIHRGADGCIQTMYGRVSEQSEWSLLPKYALGDGPEGDEYEEPKRRKFTGMSGQRCPEGLQLRNPCWAFSGTNWFIIPCP